MTEVAGLLRRTMECLSMRRADESHDRDDIRKLIEKANLKTPEEALGVVAKYYPENMLSAKTRFGIEEIFSEMEEERDCDDTGFPPR